MISNHLAGSRILIVEDEYFLADEASTILSGAGAEVIGPVPTVVQARDLIDADPGINGALLDINLRGETAFDLADMLQARGIPFAFLTGYDQTVLAGRFADASSLGKPVRAEDLIEAMERLAATRPAGTPA